MRHSSQRHLYHRMKSDAEPVFVGFSSAEAIRRITRQNGLDPRLMPTDRHMMRWAESQGAGMPINPEMADSIPRAKLPPLPDDDAVITDRIVLDAPDHWKTFIFSWYRSPKPVEVIATEIGCKKSHVYWERKLVLAYLLGRLTQAGVRIPSHRFY